MSRARRERRAAERERAAAPSSEPAWLARAPLVAAALAFFVYLPSLGGGFLYDDQTVVVLNPSIRSLADLRTVLLYEPSRPLLNLTWALNYALAGVEQAWQYHLVNVAIHAGNAALLASLFLWMARRLGLPDARRAALLGAAFFAASPMAAETVAYVASRSTALVTLFSMATIRVAVTVLQGASKARLVPAFGLFVLALATKEEAAVVPLLLVLLDYFFVAGRRVDGPRTRWTIHAPFLALLPVGLAARRLVTGRWLPAPAVDPALYLLTQCAAFPAYFFRAVIPLDPAFYRHHLPATWPPGFVTVAGIVGAIALAVFAWRGRHDRPEWSFAVAALAAGLVPSSSVVALQEMVVDHRAYLGSFGVAFAVGAALARLRPRPVVLLVLALLAARSIHYQWVLADPVRAWEDAVRRAPHSGDAQCALGEAYAARQDPRAETRFKAALALDPTVARYWANLGVYYSEVGRIAEAADALRGAVQRSPQDAAIRNYHALMLQALGRETEAIAELEAAMAVEPGFAEAKIKLAAILVGRGQHDRARVLLDQAVAAGIDPGQAREIDDLRRGMP